MQAGVRKISESDVQLLSETFQLRVNAAVSENLEGCESGCHCDRIGAEGAGLVDSALRCELHHQVRRPGYRADRKSAADNFPPGHEVGLYARRFCESAERYSKTTDDFVEDQECAIPAAQVGQGFKKNVPLREQP